MYSQIKNQFDPPYKTESNLSRDGDGTKSLVDQTGGEITNFMEVVLNKEVEPNNVYRNINITGEKYYQILQETGICVIPVSTNIEEIKKTHAGYIDMINSLPEFKSNNGVKVLGGFGALGTASSFHHPFIRNLRKYIYDNISPIFNQDNRKLEYIIDRAMYRPAGQSPVAETWHRD